jgi:hypothetical protein
MIKKRSIKFWIIFWSASILFLIAWFFFWQIKEHGFKSLDGIIAHAPFVSTETKQRYEALTYFADDAFQKNQEKTYLILFQNNLEIRPGGGYLGSFAVLKTENGKIIYLKTYDLSNFDSQVESNMKPPYPLQETLGIQSWKMRDSNFSPDFETNAQKAIEFYHLGGGQENFDGVIGVTSNVLGSLLKITGPIQLNDYPGTYDSSNAIISLEYQVEKGYSDQGIEKQDRKDIMNELFEEILNRINNLKTPQKIDLFESLIDSLNQKDIQIYFADPTLESQTELADWAGQVDPNWKNDFLMVVDANIGAFKSDYYVKRSIDYTIDLSQDQPTADLKITYDHTAVQKDWMTTNYRTYLRVYVPDGSHLDSWTNNDTSPVFGNEFGKKYFGSLVTVPVGETKTVELKYTLPDNIKNNPYDLKIQKESGINDVPVSLHIIDKKGNKKDYNLKLNSDIMLNEDLNN